MGTLLAVMMVVALSLPETCLLHRVLKPPLLALCVAIVGASIVAVGYLFNVLLGPHLRRVPRRRRSSSP